MLSSMRFAPIAGAQHLALALTGLDFSVSPLVLVLALSVGHVR